MNTGWIFAGTCIAIAFPLAYLTLYRPFNPSQRRRVGYP